MKNLFQELPETERELALKENCTKVERNYKVQRHFTKDELDGLRETVADDSILISELKDKIKLITAPITEEIKTKAVALKENLKLVKQKYEESEEDVYLIADHTTNMMHYYDAKGELVNSRRLLPHERQTRLVDMNKSDDQSIAI